MSPLQLASGVAWAAVGDLDRTFSTDGKVLTAFKSSAWSGASDALVQPNGKIVAAGTARFSPTSQCNGGRFALARYMPRGTLDKSFGGDGKIVTAIGDCGDEALAVARQPDGKIVAAGGGGVYISGEGHIWYQLEMVRYNPDGSLDESFGEDGVVAPSM